MEHCVYFILKKKKEIIMFNIQLLIIRIYKLI